MDTLEYRAWEADASEVVVQWNDVHKVPLLTGPAMHRWESRAGDESNTLMAWTGDAYQETWAKRLHERIGDAILADRADWKSQLAFYSQVYSKFFRPQAGQFVFNAMIVTPSRLPMRLWNKIIPHRTKLIEVMMTPPLCPSEKFQGRRIRLTGMAQPLELDTEGLIWARQPNGLHGTRSLVKTRVQRVHKEGSLTVQRLCQVDFDDEKDFGLLKAGKIPALEEEWVQGTEDGRVMAPLVQLFRIDNRGGTDLLVFETGFASGRLVDIRWSRQGLAPFLLPHPYYAAALNAVCTSKERLI